MPLFTRAPASAPTRPAPAAKLNFDERLALAPLSIGDTPVDYADVIRLVPDIGSQRPIAALFLRARARIQRDGWSRDSVRNHHGAICLIGAIQAEARDGHEEQEARIILRELGGGENIPTFNRSLKSEQHALLVLGRAAQVAAERGL